MTEYTTVAIFRTRYPREEVFSRFTRFFTALGWDVKALHETATAVDGKNFSWVVMILLIIFIWPAAIIYYLAADRHKVALLAESEGTYKIIVSGDKALEVLEQLYHELKAEDIRLVRPQRPRVNVRDLYDKILDYYTSLYGSAAGRRKLKEKINRLVNTGLTEEEAVKRIYEDTFGTTA
ncbi:MAG: hypothetical protein DRJ47_08765 [Thermoprotei archaeon]|nr:MAG: hypothetical protein DRJ47_08765 [Thermoprotei archaeon]